MHLDAAAEIIRAGMSEHDLAVLEWIQDLLINQPEMENRTLLALTRAAGGSVAEVTRMRAYARTELGIERHGRGGVLDVERFLRVAGARRKEEWTPQHSFNLRVQGWVLLNDPYPPEMGSVTEQQIRGSKRLKTLAESLADNEVATGDTEFNIAVRALRNAMKRLSLQAVTVEPGAVLVTQRVVLQHEQPDGAAPFPGKDKTDGPT